MNTKLNVCKVSRGGAALIALVALLGSCSLESLHQRRVRSAAKRDLACSDAAVEVQTLKKLDNRECFSATYRAEGCSREGDYKCTSRHGPTGPCEFSCTGIPTEESPEETKPPPEQCDFAIPSSPTRGVWQSSCIASEVRAREGALSHGWRTIPVDVVVAQVGTPPTAVRTNAQITHDFLVLNNAFAPALINFRINTVTTSPGAPSAATKAVFSNRVVFPPGGANVVAFYADTYEGDAFGAAREFGVVFSAKNMPDSTVPHEFGHVLGARHTHDCVQNSDSPGEASRNGDEVTDTPNDPGQVATDCYSAPAPSYTLSRTAGGCVLSTTATGSCSVTCTGGDAPDPTNIMSYYLATCRTRFTPGQIEFMRCYARTEGKSRVECTAPEVPCGAVVDPGVPEVCALQCSGGVPIPTPAACTESCGNRCGISICDGKVACGCAASKQCQQGVCGPRKYRCSATHPKCCAPDPDNKAFCEEPCIPANRECR